MAKFYRQTDGNHGLLHGQMADEEAPAGAEVVEFDEATNQGLIDSLSGKDGFQWQDHEIVSGQILRSGQVVTLNPDSSEVAERKDFDSVVASYLSDMQAYMAIADTATNQQVRDQVKKLTQGMIRVARIVRQFRSSQEK